MMDLKPVSERAKWVKLHVVLRNGRQHREITTGYLQILLLRRITNLRSQEATQWAAQSKSIKIKQFLKMTI